MALSQVLLPGDVVPGDKIPASAKRKIGHGLHPDPSTSDYTVTIGGALAVNRKIAQISTPTARYVPHAGDLVIAQVKGSSTDFFHLYINAHSQQAFLPQLAFEGATKKTRPQLKSGDLVYAKVVSAQRNMEIELSCVNPSTGKAEPDGLGPLSGGMCFEVTLGLAERMLRREGCGALEELGDRLPGGFEIAVGRNGKVWVDCPEAGVAGIVAVGKCLRGLEDGVKDEQQKKFLNHILRDLESG